MNEAMDFDFSTQQLGLLQALADIHDGWRLNASLYVTINGQMYRYTECIATGERPLTPVDDHQFLGTATMADVRVRL